MPFKSVKQEKYLFMHPETRNVAKKWKSEFGDAPGWPGKTRKKRKKSKKSSSLELDLLKISQNLDQKGLHKLADDLEVLAHCGHCPGDIKSSCKQCKKPLGNTSQCPQCGWKESSLCTQCSMNKKGGNICPDCGNPIGQTVEAQNILDRIKTSPLGSWEETKEGFDTKYPEHPDYQPPSEQQTQRFDQIFSRMPKLGEEPYSDAKTNIWRAMSALMGGDMGKNISHQEADQLMDFIEQEIDKLKILTGDRTVVDNMEHLGSNKNKIKVISKKLTYKEKQASPCVFPKTHPKVKDNKDHFPVPDIQHGRSALQMSEKSDSHPWFNGTVEELRAAVKRAVYSKFPGLKSRKEEK